MESLLQKSIYQCLENICFLSTKEVNALRKKLELIPSTEGEILKEVLKNLKQMQKKQNSMLKKLNGGDKEFNRQLKYFLKTQYRETSKEITTQEHKEAEKLLNFENIQDV
jgi:ERCC4-type nuclease